MCFPCSVLNVKDLTPHITIYCASKTILATLGIKVNMGKYEGLSHEAIYYAKPLSLKSVLKLKFDFFLHVLEFVWVRKRTTFASAFIKKLGNRIVFHFTIKAENLLENAVKNECSMVSKYAAKNWSGYDSHITVVI